uniref:Uncharacterized protein n=1 Tax=Anguilla anguilla TaxID=7936 RepID=A0A0E9VTQ9_ANGAN
MCFLKSVLPNNYINITIF